MTEQLISPAYLEQQRIMHETTRYGGRGDKWGPQVHSLVSGLVGRDDISILDYGAGKGAFRRWMAAAAPHIDVREYDPAVPGISGPPRPADLVSCTDVLEHIEPECIDAVLGHMRSLTTRPGMFLAIALVPTDKKLPDGRGAHILVRDRAWWMDKLVAHGWSVVPLRGDPTINPAKHFATYCRRP